MRRKLYLVKCDHDMVAKERSRLEHCLHSAQKLCEIRDIQESRKVKQILSENNLLKEKLQKNVGK